MSALTVNILSSPWRELYSCRERKSPPLTSFASDFDSSLLSRYVRNRLDMERAGGSLRYLRPSPKHPLEVSILGVSHKEIRDPQESRAWYMLLPTCMTEQVDHCFEHNEF